MIPDRALAALLRIGLPILLLIAAWFGLQWYGDSREAAGITQERARWVAAAETERARQTAIREATEQLGRQIAAAVSAKVADLQPILLDIKTEAEKEDATPIAPPPPGCPPADGGLPAGSLRKLDSLR